MLDEMCATLGGRAAEEIIFGKVSTGALNDLERITKQAYAMISYFGMSETVGHLSFYDSSGQGDYSFTKPYSEKTAEIIDEEAKSLVELQYTRAKKILSDNREGLTQLADKLLEKEVIFSEDLEAIFGPSKSKRTDTYARNDALPTKEVKQAKKPRKRASSKEKDSEDSNEALAKKPLRKATKK
jgi:cell division protease FtsH